MSEFGNVIDPVLDHVVTATSATKHRGLKAMDGLESDLFPHAMGYLIEAPAEEIPDGYLQEDRQLNVGVVYVTKDVEQEDHYLQLDAIRAELYGDRTLGGVVQKLMITNTEPSEDPNSGRMVTVITVQTARVDS